MLALALGLLPHLIWAGVVVYAINVTLYRLPVRFHPSEGVDDAFANFTVPDDLMALALQHPEPWAQEDVLKVVRERYEMVRDWNLVRSAMGIGIRTPA